MPYAPSVNDNSGQIMAQGMQQAFGAIANGISTFAQNQAMSKTAMGKFQGAVAADPNFLKLFESGQAPADAQKAYDTFKKTGKADVWDASMLSTFADAYFDQKKQAMAAQQQAQQFQMQQMQMDEMRRQQANDQATRTLLSNINSGVGKGVYAPQVQNNPFLNTAAQLQQVTGQTPSARDMMQFMAKSAGNEKEGVKEQTLPGGAKVAFSPSTGAFSVLPQSPDQIAEAEAAKTTAAMKAKDASEMLKSLSDSAESARDAVSTVDRISSLYKQGAQSGMWQPSITEAKSAFARFGIGKNLGTQQQFEQEMNKLQLMLGKEWMKGTGSVTENERKLVAKASANPNLTPEANLRILGVMKNLAQRTIKLQDLRNQLEDRGLSEVQVARELERARASMPIGVEGIADLASDEEQAPAPSASQSTGNASSILQKYGIR